MSLILWQKISDNFVDLIEDTVNPELVTKLKRNEKELNLSLQSTSLFNGSYSIRYGGINSFEFTVAQIIDYDVDVILQVSYEKNINDVLNSYDAMLADVEQIISYRLNYDYFLSDILLCNLKSAPAPIEAETSAFVVWELVFNVTGRVTL
jgi:hypothetical protein